MSKITMTKEFVNPVKEMEWSSEGVAQEGADQTIVYMDEDRGTYCRILRFPEEFGEHTENPEHSCCTHNFDEMVYIAYGGAINRRLGYRYHTGSISNFPAGVNHGPLWTPFGALLVEFRHYRDEHLKGIKGDGETQDKEFLNPLEDMKWIADGVRPAGASEAIVYKDKDLGSYCRAVRLPVGFGENGGSSEDGCYVNEYDEVMFIVSGGLINRRLGHRYQPGEIAVFPAGVKHGPFEAPFGALLIGFCHYRK